MLKVLTAIPPCGLFLLERLSECLSCIAGSCSFCNTKPFKAVSFYPVSTIGIRTAEIRFLLLASTPADFFPRNPYSINCGAVGKPFDFFRTLDCLVRIATSNFVVRICH